MKWAQSRDFESRVVEKIRLILHQWEEGDMVEMEGPVQTGGGER